MKIHRCPIIARWFAVTDDGISTDTVRHTILVIEHDDGSYGWLREWTPEPRP